MVKVKICGITSFDDAVEACENGADLLGFIFVKGTPRYIDPDRASGIVHKLRSMQKDQRKYTGVGMVGLFKDEKRELVQGILSHCSLDYVQLHGEESPDYCHQLKENKQIKIIKAFKVKENILLQGTYNLEDYSDADYFVFDTYHPEVSGGTGVKFNWDVLKEVEDSIKKRSFIAGGLTPENVEDAVRTVHPYGVDVSSGVEKLPGQKDYKLLKEFIENAKKT